MPVCFLALALALESALQRRLLGWAPEMFYSQVRRDLDRLRAVLLEVDGLAVHALVAISVVSNLHDSCINYERDIHKAAAECRVSQVQVAIGDNSSPVGRSELRGAEP